MLHGCFTPVLPTAPGSAARAVEAYPTPSVTELVRRIRRYTHAKLRCLVIKYKADTRYSDERMSTHDRSELDAKPCAVLAEAEESLDGVDVVGIDEGQFFPDVRSPRAPAAARSALTRFLFSCFLSARSKPTQGASSSLRHLTGRSSGSPSARCAS